MSVSKDYLPIAGASGNQGTASYTIDQSIRFNPGDSSYMHKTYSGAGDRTSWTWSCWFKLGYLNSFTPASNLYYTLFSVDEATNDANRGTLQIIADSGVASAIQFQFLGHSTVFLKTNRQFRDPSAWMHLVLVWDSDLAVASERTRLYINGQRETSFASESNPTSGQEIGINLAAQHRIGAAKNISNSNNVYFWDGYMAEIHFLDGYSYGPEYFGEFDSSNIWIPKEYSGSYGTNGFYIKGEDSSDLGNDSSGNNNDYTVSGLAAHDQVTDTPNNNFAVINSVFSTRTTSGAGSTHTVENGNLFQQADSYSTSNYGTRPFTVQPLNRGKWYFECEPNIEAGSGNILALVVTEESNFYANPGAQNTDRYGMLAHLYDGTLYFAYGSSSRQETNSPIPAHGNIIGTAIDFDNAKIYFFVNGTEIHGQTIASGTAATNLSGWNTSNNWIINFYTATASNNSNRGNVLFNFGQEGTFAGTQTAGGNSDSNGIGNFKHSVPSGYLALCTRNLFTD